MDATNVSHLFAYLPCKTAKLWKLGLIFALSDNHAILFIFQTMEVLRDGHELVFLYQLKEGHTNTSYACHVASQAGLPEEIVKRGSEVHVIRHSRLPHGFVRFFFFFFFFSHY